MLVVGSRAGIGRSHDCKGRGVGAAEQVHRHVRIVDANHPAGLQTQPDARAHRRLYPSI